MPQNKYNIINIEQKFKNESRRKSFYDIFFEIVLDTVGHQYIYCPSMETWFLWDFDELKWYSVNNRTIYDIIRKMRVYLTDFIETKNIKDNISELLSQPEFVDNMYDDLCTRLKHQA